MKAAVCKRLPWILAYIAGVVICFVLGHWDRIGADCYYFEGFVARSGVYCYYRSVLTVFIHEIVYVLFSSVNAGLRSISNLSLPDQVVPWYSIALSSSLAGSGYLLLLFRFSRSPVFWAINLSAGCVWVFFGHVENYAWVSFFLVLSLYELREYEEGRQPLWKSIACFGLAVASHHLAIFYALGFAYFLWKRRIGHRERYEVVVPLLVCIAFLIVVPLVVKTEGTELGFQRLVPVFSPWAKNQLFTLFSVDHLRMIVFFNRTAAPFGVPFLSLVLIVLFAWRLSTPFLRSVAVMAFCGLLWTTFWHPDWGYRDWDLFGQFGILANLLAGLLIAGATERIHETETKLASRSIVGSVPVGQRDIQTEAVCDGVFYSKEVE